MATVEIRNLSKTFISGKERIEALQQIHLDALDGRITALVGPSGCGKTTLLRLIAGLETMDTGDILIDQRSVANVPPKDRDIAMVFQNYALYPHMTVFDNMAFGLKVRHLPREEIGQRIAETAAMLKIESLLKRKPRELSGGQRQRVAIGRALVRRPKVFLMDEPLSNLDAQLRNEMRIELYRLAKDLRWTMIYVTHDQLEAMTLADTMVILRDGRVMQAGAPFDIFQKPANTFVATFIGLPTMNLLQGRPGDKGWHSEGDFVLSVATPIPQDAAFVGVRPDHCVIEPEVKASGSFAKLRFVERTGSDELVYFQWGQQLLTIRRPASSLSPPQKAAIRLLPEHLHYFDKLGNRI